MNRENIAMSYDKRIIIDFDDTISIAFDRGWDNASPNMGVVNKINILYEKGWEIWILTARGQLSCQGNSKAADKKYRKIIEAWLQKYDVKYHTLSFDKTLATYYVDDKAMSPEAFVKLDITDIKTGWSGAEIQRRGDRIYKTHKNAIDAAKWYAKAAPLINVPKIHSLIGETLCMEYLQSNGENFKIDDIIGMINTFSMGPAQGVFPLYLEKLKAHCDYHNDYHEIIDFLEKDLDYFDVEKSFMHGDLSIENIITTDNGAYLIDPLWSEDQYSSYLLDISKMMCSLALHGRMFERDIFFNKCLKEFDINGVTIHALVMAHYIRILKYAPNKIISKRIKDLLDSYILFEK